MESLQEGPGPPFATSGGQGQSQAIHPPKPRKPYQLTKAREKWTDQEHTRFLEAIRLHGRAWKKIEGGSGKMQLQPLCPCVMIIH